MTTTLAQRAEVAAAVAAHLASPELRDYLDQHPSVQDADGDPVVVALAADDSIEALITTTSPHAHSVMLSTIFDGHFFVCVLGASVAPGDAVIAPDAASLDTDPSTTVADLVRMLLPLEDGAEFVITYSHSRASKDRRVLVGSR